MKYATVVRYSTGLKPIKQKNNKFAPCKTGYWAFFEGWEDIGITGCYGAFKDIYPEKPEGCWDTPEVIAWRKHCDGIRRKHFRRFKFQIGLDEMIYAGWNVKGHPTIAGFFQCGEWQFMSVREAMKGMRRRKAREMAKVASGGWSSIDMADYQIFIPASAKLVGV